MTDPFVAEIRVFGFGFAPKGWAMCNGQLLPISQNTALFALLGTTYGGDGRSTFALPNLNGAAPMHPGQGPGLTVRDLGETGGSDHVTLLESEMPVHTHAIQVSAAEGIDRTPANGRFANEIGGINSYAAPAGSTDFAPQTLSATGGGLPHNNLQPYLTLNFCIALQGIFPPRS
ncbi:phage tail protein [Intrasporangium calvum]|uniref:Tail Collar domain protein n=1 Tax=Intrasporangium calvum (strain ATCC 23552 / DSM 43043 / JCM 3097 / NBRC 12989 / NCIMB 10167 / NRRL B-3866 / 7 KIP) TaxID=710696 RepID=E6SD10_INTC7|nr:tail fiber protein [Intrasporangium calvum]ADU48598.1 Tail Collar domain protein [Intrasporangium calvum DSM 43043]AXG13606.1 phage tail protein [Intrasporangium calvum]